MIYRKYCLKQIGPYDSDGTPLDAPFKNIKRINKIGKWFFLLINRLFEKKLNY
jgi:hypothetical protein